MLTGEDWLSIVFGTIALVGVVGGLINRSLGAKPKGIGSQFLRYTAMTVAMPIAGALTLQDKQVEAVVAIAMGALGFFYAGNSED